MRDDLNIKTDIYDVIIFGSGPAGSTAAIYTSRADLHTLVVAGQPAGGQLTETTEVENFPGFPEGIQGGDLIENFKKQAVRFGAEYVEENVTNVSGNADSGFTVTTGSGRYSGKSLIIATGASARWLSLDSIKRLKGKGVSACATCDGYFFKDKVVVVVGAGDVAMEEAVFLTKFASKVYVLVRKGKDGVRASEVMKTKAFNNSKVEFMFNTEVKEVLGETKVNGLVVINNNTNEETVLDDVGGVFMAIGYKPNTDFLTGFIDLGDKGYIEPIEDTKTSKKGVFVAGDVSDWKYQQAVTAAGFGCMAALDVEEYLSNLGN